MTRVVWLGAFMLGLVVCSSVMQTFEALLHQELELAFFIPLLIGHAGNSGGQTITTIVRELGCGHLQPHDIWRVARSETAAGVLQSVLLSMVLIPYMLFTLIPIDVIISVCITMIILGSFANLCGAVFPFIATRLHLDPAVVVAPLMTTIVDASGILVYLSIAMAVLRRPL